MPYPKSPKTTIIVVFVPQNPITWVLGPLGIISRHFGFPLLHGTFTRFDDLLTLTAEHATIWPTSSHKMD